MKRRSWIFASAAACAAALAFAADGPPLAGVWNIAPTGRAGSSGDLHFRIRQNDGSDPLDITVPVVMGAKETTVARSIHNSLGAQLRRDRFKVEIGEGSNVLVSDSRGRPNFSLELVDSDVEDLRVAVQSVTPAISPTVPQQEVPAVPPTTRSPEAPGAANPPPGDAIPVPGSGMGIPDSSTPRVPNASPPATPSPPVTPATPPASPPASSPPESPPPASTPPG